MGKKGRLLFEGISGDYIGTVVAKVRVVNGDEAKIAQVQVGEILVASRIVPSAETMSQAEYDKHLKRATAMIIDTGGVSSSGMIIANATDKLCISGTTGYGVQASKHLKDGQVVLMEGHVRTETIIKPDGTATSRPIGAVYEYVPDAGEILPKIEVYSQKKKLVAAPTLAPTPLVKGRPPKLDILKLIADVDARRKVMNQNQADRLRELAKSRKYGRGEQHAEEVSKLCLRIYDELCRLKLVTDSDNDRAILKSASLLHDFGYPKEPHNEVGFDLLAVEIPRVLAGEPLSPKEFSTILYCVLWHRDSNFAKRNDIEIADIPYTRKMASIVRVADALDRTLSQAVDNVSLEQDLTFWISSGSSARIEMTRACEKRDLMKQAFGLDNIHFKKK